MFKPFRSLVMIFCFLAWFSLTAQATPIADLGFNASMSANLYVFDVNPIPSEDVFTLTGVAEEYWKIAKIEDQPEPPGGGIGATSSPFSLTVTSGQATTIQATSGTWLTDIEILAFQLKAGEYSLFAVLDTPAMSGNWDLQPLYEWFDSQVGEEGWNKSAGWQPALSHFSAYAPVPEPATMMLFGIGLLGLAGVSRRKK